MARKQQNPASFVDDIPVKIPIPRWILEKEDQQERRLALKECWESYGYSDQYTVIRIEDGQFIMVRKDK